MNLISLQATKFIYKNSLYLSILATNSYKMKLETKMNKEKRDRHKNSIQTIEDKLRVTRREGCRRMDEIGEGD